MPHNGKLTVSSWHSRACLAALMAGIVAHIWMLATHNHGILLTIATAAMVLVCTPCIPAMWSRPTSVSTKKLMVSAMVMAMLHAGIIVSSGPPTDMAGHVHNAAVPSAAASSSTMTMLMIIAIELVTAFLAASLLSAHRRTIAVVAVPCSFSNS